MTEEEMARIVRLETTTAVLEERSVNQGQIITEVKKLVDVICSKLDKALQIGASKPSWAVSGFITALFSLCVGLIVFIVCN